MEAERACGDSFWSRSHRTGDVAGLLALALSALILFALAMPDAGFLGAGLRNFCLFLFGTGAWAVPALTGAVSLSFLKGNTPTFTHLVGGLCLIFLAVLGGLARPLGTDYMDPHAVTTTGGYVGALLGWGLHSMLGGAMPIGIGTIAMVGFVLCVNTPIRTMLSRTKERAVAIAPKVKLPARAPKDPASPSRTPRRNAISEAIKTQAREDLASARTVIEEPEIVEAAPPREKRPTKPRPTAAEPEPMLNADIPVPKEGYNLPPLNLLAEALLQPERSAKEMQKNIETLEGTLEQFGIEANVVEVANGPTVTRYEIQLGRGVRVSRITALADNIAMDLAASQVRVEAPIPGKSAIGVEVPNVAPLMVTLRELCDSKDFMNHPSRLYIALGKDVGGANKYADLTKMPHLLIGGATNSGKSIGLATLITSLLMRNTPKDVRLVMIDPKRVELTLFDHIPHLMCPVIKDVKEAAGVLRAVWREMDRRFDMFSEQGCRNIDGWNAKATFQDRLPYIVVIIDELADLMIQCGAEVETVIVRLAQLARAVGIHLVIATQRPISWWWWTSSPI